MSRDNQVAQVAQAAQAGLKDDAEPSVLSTLNDNDIGATFIKIDKTLPNMPRLMLTYLGDFPAYTGKILKRFKIINTEGKFDFSPDDKTFDLVKMPEPLQGKYDVLKNINKYARGGKNTKKNRKGGRKKGNKGSKGRKCKSRKSRK